MKAYVQRGLPYSCQVFRSHCHHRERAKAVWLFPLTQAKHLPQAQQPGFLQPPQQAGCQRSLVGVRQHFAFLKPWGLPLLLQSRHWLLRITSLFTATLTGRNDPDGMKACLLMCSTECKQAHKLFQRMPLTSAQECTESYIQILKQQEQMVCAKITDSKIFLKKLELWQIHKYMGEGSGLSSGAHQQPLSPAAAWPSAPVSCADAAR